MSVLVQCPRALQSNSNLLPSCWHFSLNKAIRLFLSRLTLSGAINCQKGRREGRGAHEHSFQNMGYPFDFKRRRRRFQPKQKCRSLFFFICSLSFPHFFFYNETTCPGVESILTNTMKMRILKTKYLLNSILEFPLLK